ncbi:hypothetical protein CH35J_012845 [Colletotrichum higginsianum]|uniref:Helicase C-terminal domain-containing protein n=1 Tax=Colletotrichum higginsianum TaxID=80884 RepID=A0A4T0VCJ5_9PEZI|nr:hypothetical protein CH35J_012845 [Colletotrichum higginsianum]
MADSDDDTPLLRDQLERRQLALLPTPQAASSGPPPSPKRPFPAELRCNPPAKRARSSTSSIAQGDPTFAFGRRLSTSSPFAPPEPLAPGLDRFALSSRRLLLGTPPGALDSPRRPEFTSDAADRWRDPLRYTQLSLRDATAGRRRRTPRDPYDDLMQVLGSFLALLSSENFVFDSASHAIRATLLLRDHQLYEHVVRTGGDFRIAMNHFLDAARSTIQNSPDRRLGLQLVVRWVIEDHRPIRAPCSSAAQSVSAGGEPGRAPTSPSLLPSTPGQENRPAIGDRAGRPPAGQPFDTRFSSPSISATPSPSAAPETALSRSDDDTSSRNPQADDDILPRHPSPSNGLLPHLSAPLHPLSPTGTPAEALSPAPVWEDESDSSAVINPDLSTAGAAGNPSISQAHPPAASDRHRDASTPPRSKDGSHSSPDAAPNASTADNRGEARSDADVDDSSDSSGDRASRPPSEHSELSAEAEPDIEAFDVASENGPDAPDPTPSTGAAGVDAVISSAEDEATWAAACTFFGHYVDRQSISPEDCLQLPGTAESLRPSQLYDAFTTLRTVRDGRLELGSILAHEMGVGKTLLYEAIIAVRRLAVLSAAHLAAFPERHRTDYVRCGLSGRPFGIACACEMDSLTAAIAATVGAGATMLLVPANLLDEAFDKAQRYFLARVTFPGLGPLGAPWVQPFVRAVVFCPDKPDAEILSTARADLVDTTQGKPLASRTGHTKLRTGVDAAKVLADSNASYKLGLPQSAATPPSSIVAIFSRETYTIQQKWFDRHTAIIRLRISGSANTVAVQVPGAYYFGLVVWDECHKVRQVGTQLFERLRHSFARQSRRPMLVAATGSPVTSNFGDLTLPLSLLRGTTADRATKALRKELQALGSQLQDPATREAAIMQGGSLLRGIQRRTSNSTFFGHPITSKGRCETETLDCPVDPRYADAITERSRSAGRSILKALGYNEGQSSQATPPNGGESKTTKLLSQHLSLNTDTGIRRLELALHFPGLTKAWDALDAQLAKAPLPKPPSPPSIPTTVDELGPFLKKAVPGKNGMPATYAYEASVPPEIRRHLDDILTHSTRLNRLRTICHTATQDRQVYPADGRSWHAFAGPKNVLVFCRWPLLAFLVQLWFETRMSRDRVCSGLLHSGLSGSERRKLFKWFRTFHSDAGGHAKAPKTVTKVLVTTYALAGTGLDDLKVANYCVHLGPVRDNNDQVQASGRVDRSGQPLVSYVYCLQSSEQPLDQLTVRIRDNRNDLFGSDGLLAAIMSLAARQTAVSHATGT